MTIAKLENKRFHIPTELIKDASEGAREEEEKSKRVDAMTDEQYEVYIDQHMKECERACEEDDDFIPIEGMLKLIKEDERKLEREEKNLTRWKNILSYYRKEQNLQFIR